MEEGEPEVAIAWFLGDSPVACPGMGGQNTGFEQWAPYHIEIEIEQFVVDVGRVFDYVRIRDLEVHHQDNRSVLDQKDRPDPGY